MAGGVVVLRDGLPEPAVLLLAVGIARLPDPDRVEVGEVRFRVADALDDRDLALIPEALDPAHRAVEAEARVERERGVRGARQRRPEVAQRQALERDDGLQTVGAAGEL